MAEVTPKSSSIVTPAKWKARRIERNAGIIGGTPDCYATVRLETPVQRSRPTTRCGQVENLKVAVRVRPMNERELNCPHTTNAIEAKNSSDLVVSTLSQNGSLVSTRHEFQYDHVFLSYDEDKPDFADQALVYEKIGKPVLESALKGYNGCLLAYGQTGSGKSYSMMGEFDKLEARPSSEAGIIPRFCRDIFEELGKLGPTFKTSVEVSYFEIYNEKIHDLLQPVGERKGALKVREHPVWGPYVVDLSVHQVRSYEEARTWLDLGNRNKVVAATAMNEKSSRSHSIFSVEISLCDDSDENGQGKRSKVSLVDLAGSERLGSSTTTTTTTTTTTSSSSSSSSSSNEERLRQGICINKSLLTLGKVISALAEQKRGAFVPYRESILTWLLRESLGGNSLTSMIATISPASTHVDETLATLRYACQAKSIVNRACVNEDPHDRQIRELRSEVERLRSLSKTYERHSVSSNSVSSANDSSLKELDLLRCQLLQKEEQLEQAKLDWDKRVLVMRQKQLAELDAAERLKVELNSKMAILDTVDPNIPLTPYQTDFFQNLDGIIADSPCKMSRRDVLTNIEQFLERSAKWCDENDVKLKFSYVEKTGNVHIHNLANNTETTCPYALIEEIFAANQPNLLYTGLEWKPVPAIVRRNSLKKENPEKCFGEIYKYFESLMEFAAGNEELMSVSEDFADSLEKLEKAFGKYKFRTPNKSVKFVT